MEVWSILTKRTTEEDREHAVVYQNWLHIILKMMQADGLYWANNYVSTSKTPTPNVKF